MESVQKWTFVGRFGHFVDVTLDAQPSLKWVQCNRILEIIRRKVRVRHSLLDAGMPENLLKCDDVSSVHHKMAGKGVSKHMCCLAAR